MSEDRYRVVISAAVADQLRECIRRADTLGLSSIARRAAAWIESELERTPNEFGESREHFETAKMSMRIAFCAPLFVTFGVHQIQRIVFVKKIGWNGGDGD